MRTRLAGPVVIGAVAFVALFIVGLVLWFTAPDDAASFGWYAYAPLADNVSFAGVPMGLYGQRLAAAAVLAAASLVAGVSSGFHWGRGIGRVEHPRGP